MTREEIIQKIKEFAKENGYETTEYLERIAEAKRRMDKGWNNCPCVRDGLHYCGSEACKKEIEEKGICDCHLYVRGK